MNYIIANKKELTKSLSSKELVDLVPDANVITYQKLATLNNIDDALFPHGKLFILYQFEPTYGHWCCLFVRDNSLNFFNSYGKMIDDPATYKGVSINMRQKLNETQPKLLELMLKSRYKILNFNEYRFQGKDTCTCGRFCTVRLWMWKLDDKEFYEFIKDSQYNADVFVTLLTENKLKKFNLPLISFI